MNREIKFRAWNKKIKSMGSAFPLDVILMDIAERPNAYYADKDNIIIMQFTGLRDKNGKEIYEGDIIKVLDDDYVPENIGVVVWGGDYPAFTIKGSSFEDLEYNTLQHACSVVECEVIGNIFEHEHLLIN